MSHQVTYKGIIEFDPPDVTKKHSRQASWKKVAIIKLPYELSMFYRWLIFKRFNILLNPVIKDRGSHVTLINDAHRDFNYGLDRYELLKEHFNGTEIDVTLDLTPNTNGEHWWLRVTPEFRHEMHSIRSSFGLAERPYFGLHMTIGYTNVNNEKQSTLIKKLCQEGIITDIYESGTRLDNDIMYYINNAFNL